LTGRHINVELFPFSFGEALLFRKEIASPDSFEWYFKQGGFPDFIKYGRPEILRELFTDILQRGIISRHKIRETKALHELALYLLSNVGKEFSYNSLKKMFQFGSVNTPISFVSYLEDSYLLFTIPKFDYSLKKQMINEKKVYSIDNGLSNANSVSFSSNKGRMLENFVFITLRRSHKNIYYFRENGECDFLIKEDSRIIIAIQVAYELNEDNKKREIEGLLEAMRKFELREGFILTYNQEDEIDIEDKRIIIKPVWRWI
jgi:Predicted ATPase (AAA+ superfamily)